jgi:thymidylate synthase (FAD)
MEVKLIAYTDPKIDGIENLSDFIAYVARVSNPGNQMNTKTSKRLIKYLIKHKHWSPFEMAHVVMEIKTTRDIARQILRHRSFSFQEFSQRYAVPEYDSYEFREARAQDPDNRQNSIEILDEERHVAWEYYQREVMKAADRAYKWAQGSGLAKEQARAVLPEGLTPSTLYMSGSVRSWLHYIELRSGEETQKEHREIAVACGEILEELVDV